MAFGNNLAFLESVKDGDTTKEIGGFSYNTDCNTFDKLFEEAVDNLNAKNINYFMDINQLIRDNSGAIMKVFKEKALSGITNECAERDANEWGTYSTLGQQISQLWDNCTASLFNEATSSGQLMPITAIDYPVIVKQHLALATKDVVQTTVVDTPVVKKQIEHRWIVNPKDRTQRWEYPQCMYTEEWKQIFDIGKGLKIKEDPQTLPLFNFNIIDTLTDAAVPEREKLSYNVFITKVLLDDDTAIPVDMYINLHQGNIVGGNIKRTVKKADNSEVEVEDCITGQIDFYSGNINVSSASGQIKKIVFGGYLSNETNERSVTFDYTREEKEWKIGDGHRVAIPYSLEELNDAKALLHMDLYQKSYTNMAGYLTDMEDNKTIQYLDEMYDKYSGMELDPMGFNGFVRTMNFDCDATTVTTALPADYIEKQLKFQIDRFIIDLTETAKLEDMTFVIYGNPRYVSLLGDSVKWVINRGSSTGGVKHNYSYGIMNTSGVTIQVVSALKFSSTGTKHQGLRLIPFPMDKEQFTFGHFKYGTHIMTGNDSNYRDSNTSGGSKTYLLGVSRYEDASIQAIQGYMTFSNADFIKSSNIY